MFTLNFEALWIYDAADPGITIPIELRIGANSVKPDAKVDTGSTFCIFQREHGEALGLKIESGLRERISTATGSFIVYGHNVLLSALGFEWDAIIYFAEQPEIKRNVLGRYGFLQQLKLAIVDYDGKLYLGRYDLE